MLSLYRFTYLNDKKEKCVFTSEHSSMDFALNSFSLKVHEGEIACFRILSCEFVELVDSGEFY